MWDIAVGSHIDAGEFPLACAKRGLKEKLGIDVFDDQLESLEQYKEQFVDHGVISNEFVSTLFTPL